MQWFKGDTKRLHRISITLLMLLLLTKSHVLAGERAFSVVVLPDPQRYASKYTKIGMAQTEWICQQADELQIKFVVTVGDNVNAGYVDKQFKNSVRFMDQLNKAVP